MLITSGDYMVKLSHRSDTKSTMMAMNYLVWTLSGLKSLKPLALKSD